MMKTDETDPGGRQARFISARGSVPHPRLHELHEITIPGNKVAVVGYAAGYEGLLNENKVFGMAFAVGVIRAISDVKISPGNPIIR